MLRPDQPFTLHQLLFQTTYLGWNEDQQGPAPTWIPTLEGAKATNAGRFMQQLFDSFPALMKAGSGDPRQDYPILYDLSVSNPEVFWSQFFMKQLNLRFHQAPSRMVVHNSREPDATQWLANARLNIAEVSLTGHDPDRPAIVWAHESSPQSIETVTRAALMVRVQQVADALQAIGMNPSDAVALDMSFSPDAVAAFLGIILAGCVAVPIAESFAVPEIASRLRIAKAKAVFTQDYISRGGKSFDLYGRIVEANGPPAIVLTSSKSQFSFQARRKDDISFETFLTKAEPCYSDTITPYVADGYDVATILFSSGTTGEPKAIPWTHLTPLRAAADGFFHQDIRMGDTVCWPTSLGWMMGPWLTFATLINGATIALFEGSPLSRSFGIFVQSAQVTVLGLVPSIARAWRASDCMSGLDWSFLRCFSSTGEASGREEYMWLSSRASYCPVIEYCGGTEIGGGFLSGSMLQPQAPATFSTPTMGSRPVVMLKADNIVAIKPGQSPASSVVGELALEMPMLGTSQRLLNADHKRVYYDGMPRPGLRRHGDEVQILPQGYCRAHGRVDDTMNLGGIKVSSIELERVIMENVGEVKEVAAVAISPPQGGPDQLVLFAVVEDTSMSSGSGEESVPALQQKCQAAISKNLNPLFKVFDVKVVASLPRTASNKIVRRVLRDRYYKLPSSTAPTRSRL